MLGKIITLSLLIFCLLAGSAYAQDQSKPEQYQQSPLIGEQLIGATPQPDIRLDKLPQWGDVIRVFEPTATKSRLKTKRPHKTMRRKSRKF